MKLPKGQKLWETHRDEKGRVKWAITSDLMRSSYILWMMRRGELEKVKSASSPIGFYKIMKGEGK